MYGNTIVQLQLLLVEFVEDNAAVSLTLYFENRVSYFVQNQRK